MKILAVQNRMGIGDMIIFLPFIEAISKKFNSPISILVKENSKADQFLNQTTYIDKIIYLKHFNEFKISFVKLLSTLYIILYFGL